MTSRFPKAILFLSVPLLLAGLWWTFTQGDATTLAGEGATPLTHGADEADIAFPELDLPIVEEVARVAEEPSARRDREVREASEEQLRRELLDRIDPPGSGVIHGKLVDSFGDQVQGGRVLVFTEDEETEPIAVLKVEGPEWEYRGEFPADESYWIQVDPDGLPDGYIPALARSLARPLAQPIAGASGGPPLGSAAGSLGFGAQSSDSVGTFARGYVFLEDKQEVRQDLVVGRLTRVVGRLVAADWSPVPGAVARLVAQHQSQIGLVEEQTTDEEGFFTFSGVFPGNYRLKFFEVEEGKTPIQPVDIEVRAVELNDLGEIRIDGGSNSITGHVVNQDGWPFPGLKILCYSDQQVQEGVPPHDMGSLLSTATTDEGGFFQLENLPAIPVKVSLTPDYNPNSILGAGSAAYWEPAVLVQLTAGVSPSDIGTHTVEESRPFAIYGQFVFGEEWWAQGASRRKDLRAVVKGVEGLSLPPRVRRAAFREKRLDLNWEEGTYQLLVETPMTELEVRFQLAGYQDLVFRVQPTALATWSKEIHVPSDFRKIDDSNQ